MINNENGPSQQDINFKAKSMKKDTPKPTTESWNFQEALKTEKRKKQHAQTLRDIEQAMKTARNLNAEGRLTEEDKAALLSDTETSGAGLPKINIPKKRYTGIKHDKALDEKYGVTDDLKESEKQSGTRVFERPDTNA